MSVVVCASKRVARMDGRAAIRRKRSSTARCPWVRFSHSPATMRRKGPRWKPWREARECPVLSLRRGDWYFWSPCRRIRKPTFTPFAPDALPERSGPGCRGASRPALASSSVTADFFRRFNPPFNFTAQ